MRQECLANIVIHLPVVSEDLVIALSKLLGTSVSKTGDMYTVLPSNELFLPTISIDAKSTETFAIADFEFMSNDILTVYITNITEGDKRNPLPYRHIELEDVSDRIVRNGMAVVGIDHMGFNLPWFNNGVHPAIADLRSRLKGTCLYHSFPSGEPWDFIIPGELAEIRRRKAVDYDKIRKPKFEIVSFDKTSVPLVQIDVTSNMTYAELSSLFPEALHDPSMKNMWIYIRNPCDIDLCLVLNESTEGDWSSYFKGHRIA